MDPYLFPEIFKKKRLEIWIPVHINALMVKQQNKYHTVETVPKSNRKVMETEAKSILLTCMYMNTHVPVLPQAH
jgi:heme O synthase-like polyprenyltransferase